MGDLLDWDSFRLEGITIDAETARAFEAKLNQNRQLVAALEAIAANGCGDAGEKCAACMAIDALQKLGLR